MKYFIDLLDELDAAVFSGDDLCSEYNVRALKEAAERWLRTVNQHLEQLPGIFEERVSTDDDSQRSS